MSAELTAVQVHPAAELFPLMTGTAFDEFMEDIRDNGLREPVVFTPDGQLLDGRNRWRACKKLGDEPPRRTEHAEPWAYVISTNVHRRHLTDSQRAMIGARIAERHKGGSSKIVLNAPIGSLRTIKDEIPSRKEMAELLNVGTTSISRGRKVIAAEIPGLNEAVESGRLKLSTAVRIIEDFEPDQQVEIVQKINNGAQPRAIVPISDTEQSRATKTKSRPVERPTGYVPKYVTQAAISHLQNSFDALLMVLNSAPDGLDPSITSEQAARWMGDLSKQHIAYRRVADLLRQRKEEPTL